MLLEPLQVLHWPLVLQKLQGQLQVEGWQQVPR